MTKPVTQTTDHFDLACKLPVSEQEWQRACEIEQKAAHEFFLSRAQNGHFVMATIMGTLVALGSMSKVVVTPDEFSMMSETLEKAFTNDEA